MEEFYSLAMLISIGTFALTSATTPGPNNIMLLSSGLTFGYKKTIPHISGIVIGFPLMVLLIGLGFGVVFEKFPLLLSGLKIVGILYLFWMALKIARNTGTYDVEESEDSKPFTFLQAATFQWVNPKAWIMAITAISIFVTANDNTIFQVVVISTIFFITAIISSNTWAFGGVVLKKFIKDESMVRKLNIAMAILLIASVLPIIFE